MTALVLRLALEKELPVTLPPLNDISASGNHASEQFRVFTQSNTRDLVDGHWITKSAAEGMNSREIYGWSHEQPFFDGEVLIRSLEKQAELLSTARYRRAGKTELMARIDGALVNISFVPPQQIWAGVAAPTQAKAAEVLDRLIQLFPETSRGADDSPSIPLSVWTQAHAEPTRRTTEVSPWGDLVGNYAAYTRERLSALMDPSFEAGKGGKLILLHGAPGTGKSTALATLAWQWRNWSELHYIADPADFLSAPEYLVHVSLSRRRDENWRVVLLEDSGGLFAPDAKHAAGEDRLGRLLNITDGMLGNTSKALFIITTNEPLSSFHSAVSRPGRCAATVEFLPLSQTEASAWFEAHDRPDLAASVSGEQTLAELYAALDGTLEGRIRKRRVGFHMSD